jgi:Methyltransferase FkbM domain
VGEDDPFYWENVLHNPRLLDDLPGWEDSSWSDRDLSGRKVGIAANTLDDYRSRVADAVASRRDSLNKQEADAGRGTSHRTQAYHRFDPTSSTPTVLQDRGGIAQGAIELTVTAAIWRRRANTRRSRDNMEGLIGDVRFAAQIAAKLENATFTLINVGCSGGIDPIWRVFGDKLRAFGFDPNLHECERLQKLEANQHVQYVAGFVGISPNHPFAKQKADRAHVTRNPWSRLSVCRTLELQQAEMPRRSVDEITQMNAWSQVALADPAKPIILPEFFESQNLSDIDFIKIDIDGPDFEALKTLSEALTERSVLGLGLEVNWIGSDNETDHTFHNTDRFMREAGFGLFNVTVRRYSAAALPGRYQLRIPAETVTGRPLQGDALYLRDICAPESAEFADRLSASKILKAAALMSIGNLPDHAAEILIKFSATLQKYCNLEPLLDTLVEQVCPGRKMRYYDYIAAFERNDPIFYPK